MNAFHVQEDHRRQGYSCYSFCVDRKKKSPEHERVNATNVPILKLQNTVRAGDVSARKERFLKGKYHIEIARSLSYTMHSVKTPPSTLDDLLTFLCAAERVSLWVL